MFSDKRIVLIDDNASDIVLFGTALYKEMGFAGDIQVFDSGASALSTFRARKKAKPDLIVADWLLPLGFPEFMEQLRAIREFGGVPVVVLAQAPESCQAAATIGAISCFPKPDSLYQLQTLSRDLGCLFTRLWGE